MSHIYYILCFVRDLFSVVLHAGLPADAKVPRERVQTVLLRAICGSTMSSIVPPVVANLNILGLSTELIFHIIIYGMSFR